MSAEKQNPGQIFANVPMGHPFTKGSLYQLQPALLLYLEDIRCAERTTLLGSHADKKKGHKQKKKISHSLCLGASIFGRIFSEMREGSVCT